MEVWARRLVSVKARRSFRDFGWERVFQVAWFTSSDDGEAAIVSGDLRQHPAFAQGPDDRVCGSIPARPTISLPTGRYRPLVPVIR